MDLRHEVLRILFSLLLKNESEPLTWAVALFMQLADIYRTFENSSQLFFKRAHFLVTQPPSLTAKQRAFTKLLDYSTGKVNDSKQE